MRMIRPSCRSISRNYQTSSRDWMTVMRGMVSGGLVRRHISSGSRHIRWLDQPLMSSSYRLISCWNFARKLCCVYGAR
ncbi:hypothetical protein KOXY103107_16245 [Komagataeibacter xylinus]